MFFNLNKISGIICVQYSILEDSCFYSSVPAKAVTVAIVVVLVIIIIIIIII